MTSLSVDPLKGARTLHIASDNAARFPLDNAARFPLPEDVVAHMFLFLRVKELLLAVQNVSTEFSRNSVQSLRLPRIVYVTDNDKDGRGHMQVPRGRGLFIVRLLEACPRIEAMMIDRPGPWKLPEDIPDPVLDPKYDSPEMHAIISTDVFMDSTTTHKPRKSWLRWAFSATSICDDVPDPVLDPKHDPPELHAIISTDVFMATTTSKPRESWLQWAFSTFKGLRGSTTGTVTSAVLKSMHTAALHWVNGSTLHLLCQHFPNVTSLCLVAGNLHDDRLDMNRFAQLQPRLNDLTLVFFDAEYFKFNDNNETASTPCVFQSLRSFKVRGGLRHNKSHILPLLRYLPATLEQLEFTIGVTEYLGPDSRSPSLPSEVEVEICARFRQLKICRVKNKWENAHDLKNLSCLTTLPLLALQGLRDCQCESRWEFLSHFPRLQRLALDTCTLAKGCDGADVFKQYSDLSSLTVRVPFSEQVECSRAFVLPWSSTGFCSVAYRLRELHVQSVYLRAKEARQFSKFCSLRRLFLENVLFEKDAHEELKLALLPQRAAGLQMRTTR